VWTWSVRPADKRVTVTMGGGRTRNNTTTGTGEQTIDDKLDFIISEMAQMKKDNKLYREDIAEIKSDIKTFKEDITKTIDMCFEEVRKCAGAVAENTKNIAQCEEDIDTLRSENISLKRQVQELSVRACAAEQYSRSNCVEIYGVPEVKGENVLLLVKQVAAAFNYKLEDGMIDAVHRLARNPAKPNNHPGIIVKFCRRLDMEELRKKTRVKREISAAELGLDSDSKVKIYQSLSREMRVLWAQVREFQRKNHYAYAWITAAGKICLRKREGIAAVHIASKEDLAGLK